MHLHAPVKLTINEIRFSGKGIAVEITLKYPDNYSVISTINLSTQQFEKAEDLLRSIAQEAYRAIEKNNRELRQTFDASPSDDTAVLWTDDQQSL